MSRARMFFRHAAAATVGATIALLVSGLGPADKAQARPAPQIMPCEYDLRHHRAELARVEKELERYQHAYNALDEGLDRITRINNYYKSARAHAQINRAIDRARTEAARYVETSSQTPHRPMAMDVATYQSLLSSMRNAGFDEHRRDLIIEAARRHTFTVAQVIGLMRECGFEETRIEVAVILYPVVVDQDNWFQVYDALSFGSSRQTLRERIH